MKNLETNKIVASVLLAAFIALLCGKAAHILYRPDKNPKERGFQVAVETDAAPADAGPVVPFEEWLAKGDVAAGKKIFEKCAACHDDAEGAGNRVGPNLYGVLGRKKGSYAGFAYSDGMKAKGGEWTIVDFHQFIKSPREYVQGTKMSFKGIAKDQDIANLVVYLRSQGSPNVPLPPPPAPSAGAAPAEKAPAAPAANAPKAPEKKK